MGEGSPVEPSPPFFTAKGPAGLRKRAAYGLKVGTACGGSRQWNCFASIDNHPHFVVPDVGPERAARRPNEDD